MNHDRNHVGRHNRTAAIASAGGLAVLGALALFNRVRTRRAEAATPPAGSFVEAGGVRLHYVERGTGPVVVLLHGNGMAWQDWQASGVLDQLARNHRVIAFDRPGFGYSGRPRSVAWTPRAQAAAIAAALRGIGVERAVVAGHSWGAMVALGLALDHPALVSGLVLLSGYYYGTARPDVVAFSTPAIPGVGDVLAHTVSPPFGALIGPAAIRASFAPAPVAPGFAAFPVALALRPSQVRATAADSALMVPGAVGLSRHYAGLSLPVTIMAGSGDRIVRVAAHAERLAGEVAGSELRIVPGQGHLFHYGAPEQVAAAIREVARRG